MEEDKPLETDSEETISDEELEKDLQEIDKDLEGGEDVQEASFFTKEEVETIVGRPIKDKEDFKKHYVNLKSKVGALPPKVEKKIEPAIEAQIPSEILGIREELNELKFIRKTPEAEKHLDLIRSIAKGDKIALDAAYEKVKSYLDASEIQSKEKDVAIESKNRIAPKEVQKLNNAIKQFKENKTDKAETDLVTEYLGLK
jgi:hypothetical protein